MSDYSLVPVVHQPDFGDVSLVPVDHDPFGADGVIQQAGTEPQESGRLRRWPDRGHSANRGVTISAAGAANAATRSAGPGLADQA